MMKLRSHSVISDSTDNQRSQSSSNQSKKRSRASQNQSNKAEDEEYQESDESTNQSVNEQDSPVANKRKKPRKIPDHSKDKRRQLPSSANPRHFIYELDYKSLNLREQPDLYRVGKGEQGVLMVEPYKSEICPLWRFKTPDIAKTSADAITKLFYEYKKNNDFIGMDMARKFLQMGYTRARRYANHASGRKYDANDKVLPKDEDPVKAESARVFYPAWQAVEADKEYSEQKKEWKKRLG